jgi:hypothetical protein
MRFTRTYILALLSLPLAFFTLSLEGPAFSQQTTSSNPEAVALLQKSLAILSGGQTISDITLSGTARRIAGSDDETGTATVKALASGAGRVDLSLSSGQRSEVENLVATPPAGSWSGPDGISHAIVFHNLLSEPSWFFPAFAIARRLSNSNFVVAYVGQETHDGEAVQHIFVSQTAPLPNPPGGASYEHLTQVDFFLDATTLLPVAISFNIHPDNNALLDLPVEIRFSDYRSINSTQIPFQVQKFLNNTLILDLQFANAQLNSGLTASLFNAQ